MKRNPFAIPELADSQKSYFFPYSTILNLAEQRAEFLHPLTPAGPYRQRRQDTERKGTNGSACLRLAAISGPAVTASLSLLTNFLVHQQYS